MPSSGHSKPSEKSLTTENVVGYIESGGAVCTIPDSHTRQTHGMYINHTLIMHAQKISEAICSHIQYVCTYACTYVHF